MFPFLVTLFKIVTVSSSPQSISSFLLIFSLNHTLLLRGKILSSQNMSLWHKHYTAFELKAMKTQLIQEKLFLLPSGILCSRKKEGAPTFCDSMDGTREHYAK